MQIFNIGRDASNQIVLNDNLISRRHAQLFILDNGQVMIKDLNSSNGTYVNGNRITECYLNTGDIVKCGAAFINWTQYINPEPWSDQPMYDQQPESDQAEYPEQLADFPETQYGIGSVFKYLATRILETGDLFKTNWKKTSSILLLMGIPVLITLLTSLIFYLKYPFFNFSAFPAILALISYVISPFIAVYLLSFIKKVSIDKVALASGMIGFISFGIYFIYTFPKLLNLKTEIPLFNFGFGNRTNLFHVFILFFLIFLAICLIISLFIFMYRYYISIGISRSISIYMVIATLLISLFFQLLLTYLLFLILKDNAINLLL